MKTYYCQPALMSELETLPKYQTSYVLLSDAREEIRKAFVAGVEWADTSGRSVEPGEDAPSAEAAALKYAEGVKG